MGEVDASENCVCLWHFYKVCFLVKCFLTLSIVLQNVLFNQTLHNIITILHNVFSNQTLFDMIFHSTSSMYAQKCVYIPIRIFVDSLMKIMLISVLKSFYVLQSID